MHSAMYAMTPCLYFCRTVANQYSEYCMETDEQIEPEECDYLPN